MQTSLQRCNAKGLASSAPKTARRLAVVVRAEGSKINSKGIRAEEEKVVDTLKASDLGKKAVLCRCWKSSKFPFCDGQHNAHNKATGDNVGPLIIEGTTPASS